MEEQMNDVANAVVVVSTIGEGHRRVGRLTLNVPRILNSLDAEMIEIMSVSYTHLRAHET